MSDFKLNVSKRTGLGKNKVDKLRDEKIVPGVIYSKGADAVHIQVNEREFSKVYGLAGTSNIVELNVDGEIKPVLFKEVQKHPFKNQFIHIDCYGIRMDEKIKVNIPVVLEGRDEIRVQPSVLMQLINEIEVECLPGNMPSEALINVEELQIGEAVHVKDLDVFKDSKIDVLTDGEEMVAHLSEPREEVVEEEVAVDPAEVPTVGESESTEA